MYKTQHQNKPLLQQTHNKDKTFRFYNKEKFVPIYLVLLLPAVLAHPSVKALLS